MNITDKQLNIYLKRYEFFFSSKRIKICEPRYIDINDGVTTIIRDHNKFSLFTYQGIIFIVYFTDKNEDARKLDPNIPVNFVWEICRVNYDKSWKKVREAKRIKFIERHIIKYVIGEAHAIF